MKVAFKTPSAQSKVVKIVECKETYTQMKGEVICDKCKEDMFLFSKTMQFGGQFLLATNLNHRKKHYNISYIKTMEDDFKRIFVVYQNKIQYCREYEVIEYFIPKDADFYFTPNESDANRLGWFSSHYGDTLEEFDTILPMEYSLGTEIEVSEVEHRKWNSETRKYE